MVYNKDPNSFSNQAYLVLIFLLGMLSSCSFFNVPAGSSEPHGKGAMLLRYASWLYCVGGLNNSGSSSASSWMTTIGEDGTLAAVQATASLPIGIRHGVAFSAGNFVYVIGGRTGSGLVSTIYYTLVNSDGTLGFGADKHWESNLRPLPEARAYMAWTLYDGWIFLIGGETPSGATDSIVRARIYQDGQVGQWYESSQVLPDARLGVSAAVMGERLYIAGGANSNGISSKVVSFALGAYGALSDRRIEPDLPLAVQGALLLADRGTLILAGGYSPMGWSSKVYRNYEGIWSDTSLTANAEGPSFGIADDTLYYQPQTEKESFKIARLVGLSLAPEEPVVIPGSGTVPNNSPIHIDGGPGVTMRYREDNSAPTAADAVWPDTSIKISSSTLPSMELSLAAFGPDGTASPAVHRTYRVRSSGFFVVIEGMLQAHNPGYTDLDYHIMQESGSAGMAPTAASSLWYRIIIDTTGIYRLTWADADENAAYSARLMLSVYEVDLYTEVPDLAGIPSRDQRGGLAAPLHLALNPGDYYVYIRGIDNQKGGDFGLSFVRE